LATEDRDLVVVGGVSVAAAHGGGEAVAVAQAAEGAGPFEQLVAASIAYVRECASGGELQRIGLRQSRAVLGWEGWRETAGPLGIAIIRAGIQSAVDAGEIASEDITTTTHLVLAVLIEAGLLAATDPEPAEALPRIEAELARILTGLRAHRPQSD
jgi:hypothetical protein